MQSDDEYFENVECTCQLLSTVQNLVEKYKRVISKPAPRIQSPYATWNFPVGKLSGMNRKRVSSYNTVNVDFEGSDRRDRRLGSSPDVDLRYRVPSANSFNRISTPNNTESTRKNLLEDPITPAQVLRVPNDTCPVHSRSTHTDAFVLPVVNENPDEQRRPLTVPGYWQSATLASSGTPSSGTDGSKSLVRRYPVTFLMLITLVIGCLVYVGMRLETPSSRYFSKSNPFVRK